MALPSYSHLMKDGLRKHFAQGYNFISIYYLMAVTFA